MLSIDIRTQRRVKQKPLLCEVWILIENWGSFPLLSYSTLQVPTPYQADTEDRGKNEDK